MKGTTRTWELALLGAVQLVTGGAPTRVDRRTAALLAYLALEGPTPRSRLAGLLWPESPEQTARSNLRQLLRRLRQSAGEELVTGKELLTLSPALRAGDADGPLGRGRPLDGLDFDGDTEALSEWIERTRAALLERRLLALMRAHERCESRGDLSGAAEAAREALELDPWSEEAHRRVMRTHALRGDRAAALAAFQSLRELLEREFGVGPSAETLALAAELSRDTAPKRAITPASPRVPLAVLRPPLFVGRAREWAQMEEAWDAGRGILLFGPAGAGKSRLMQEFLAHKGGAVTFGGRPGDSAVPYGTHARTYRELLDVIAPVELPEWVRRELARIVPALGAPAPPLRDAADKLRFFQAKVEVHRIAWNRGFRTLGFDDLQFVDPASAEAGHYVLSQLQLDRAAPVRTVHCFTTGSLSEELQNRLREAGFGSQFTLVEVGPLAEPELESMLESLRLPQLARDRRSIARDANGNPAWALTAVKQRLESDEVDPVRLAEARLEYLSDAALQLARVLAVLGPGFGFELAGHVLQKDPLALDRSWRELEAAQLVRGLQFSHRALGETLLERTPEPTRALLRRRAAIAQRTAQAASTTSAARRGSSRRSTPESLV